MTTGQNIFSVLDMIDRFGLISLLCSAQLSYLELTVR